ncbi:MAG: translation initiation factor IF-2 subunit alpha [Candidatus Bathyarchaeia archaeon]
MSTQTEYPEVGDVVVATVTRLTDYGVYVTLDEYGGKEALVHISEIATTWVKNIRDHAREGQKLVLKVLRVNPQKGQIDLSLRRVTGREKTEKLLEWKKDRKAEGIIKVAAEKLNADQNKIEEVKTKILSKHQSIFDALEEAAEAGEKALIKLGLEPEWAATLADVAKQKIKVETADVRATIEVSSTKPQGIDDVKKALINAKKVKTPRGAKIDVYTTGAPRYRVEVTARDYSEAEKILEQAVNEAIETIKSLGGTGRRLN